MRVSPIDRIDVTGERPYPVLIGRDVRAQLPATVADLGATNAMLVHQAAHAFRSWTGSEPPIATMHAAARAHLDGRLSPRVSERPPGG